MNKAAETDETKTTLPNPSAELDALRLQPDEAMTRIYREHRTAFIRWAQGWTRLNEPDLADVFQDCCVVLLKNIRTGRLTVLTASVRTYLFGIGKNLLNARLRSAARTTFPGEENLRFPADFDLGVEHRMVLNEEEKRLQTALAHLGEPCHRLLRLTFYEGMRSAKIAADMGYASEEVVRTQRKRCLDKLKTMFKRG
ncbi:MAG: RNA polymerase sigma factor [Saprospiraceae bacterium]